MDNKRIAKWFVPALLCVQAMFTGSTFATLFVTLMVFGLSAAVVYFRYKGLSTDSNLEPPSVSVSTLCLFWLLVVTMVAVWRFGSYGAESINPIAYAFDTASHFCLFAMMILWIRYLSAGHVAMLPLGFFLIMLCVASGGSSQSEAGQTTVAIIAAIAFAIASQMIFSAHYRRVLDCDQVHASSRDRQRTKWMVSAAVIASMMVATTVVARMTNTVLPMAQDLVHTQLSNTLDPVREQIRISSSRYVRGGTIGSIRNHMISSPDTVALTAYASGAPGYLRGTAFDIYSGRQWVRARNLRLPEEYRTEKLETRGVLSTGQSNVKLKGKSTRKLRRFPLLQSQSNGQPATIEIHNDPIRGPVTFTPLGAQWIDTASNGLKVSQHQIIKAGVDYSNPYVCGVSAIPPPEQLGPKQRKLLLFVPASMRETVGPIAAEVCEDAETTMDKADAISSYFQNNFLYTLDTKAEGGFGDPIIGFLKKKHPAHCEFFAAATALMLRSQDVPTRYVTGYVAKDFNVKEKHWLAKNRDAHAWVEAYDDTTQRWFPVESTPGRTYISLAMQDTENIDLSLLNSQSDDDDDDSDSILSRIWGWLTSIRAMDPLNIVISALQVPVLIGLLFILWKRSRASTATADPLDQKCMQMLRKVDRMVRRHGLVRKPNETIHQFAQRVEQYSDDPKVAAIELRFDDIAGWYRDFASARYRGQLPTAFA